MNRPEPNPEKSRPRVDFTNTEIAFQSQSNAELRRSYWLLKSLRVPLAVDCGPFLVNGAMAFGLPIKGVLKATLVRQFCGGESLEECAGILEGLAASGCGAILDYAVESRESEEDFENTRVEVLRVIDAARKNPSIRAVVVKLTGLARFDLLEKVSSGASLSERETAESSRVQSRVDELCAKAAQARLSVYLDAEESWIQAAVDNLAFTLMAKYNRDRAVVFNTVQTYRWDRYAFLERMLNHARGERYHAGVKLVRGAYMEKERAWAAQHRRRPAVHATKEETDRDYDRALHLMMDHLDSFAVCAATHNERSTELLLELAEKRGIAPEDPRVQFSQLYGMGNHLTYNLAHLGYNASKYVPYGPIELMLPYLFRRARENTSVRGTTGRELRLVTQELRRRGSLGWV